MLLNRPKNINAANVASAIAEEYIKSNYDISGNLTFENVSGMYTVNCDGDVEVKNKEIGKLTEGFVWGEVKGNFNCSCCKNLRTLEGAPEIVGGTFDCSWCEKLETLKGAPKEIGGTFNCTWCVNLNTLVGTLIRN